MKTVSVELCRELMVRLGIKYLGDAITECVNSVVDEILAENNLLPVDLVVPWDVIDERFKFAAMDQDGGIHVYESQPSPSTMTAEWFAKGNDALRLDGYINGTKQSNKPWQETLIERPKVAHPEVVDAGFNPHALVIDWDGNGVTTGPIKADYIYAAQDLDGSIWLFKDEPTAKSQDWDSLLGATLYSRAFKQNDYWMKTLTRRPGA